MFFFLLEFCISQETGAEPGVLEVYMEYQRTYILFIIIDLSPKLGLNHEATKLLIKATKRK